MTYLAQWYDPALEPKEGETKEKIEMEERQRLSKLLNIASAASIIPRRAGVEADGAELATDKQRSKRIAHVAQQCVTAWGGTTSVTDAKTEAAQVIWTKWWEQHATWLRNRMRYLATWGIKGGDEKWAKKALVRLNNELSWLEYALRG